MNILNRETTKIDKNKTTVFYLGKEFVFQGSSLYNLINSLKTTSIIVDIHGDRLKELAPFYEVNVEFLGLDIAPKDAQWLVLQPAKEDALALNGIQNTHPLLVMNSLDGAYDLDESLEGSFDYLVPSPVYEKPLHILGLPEPENLYYFRDLFGLKKLQEDPIGTVLWKIFDLLPAGGGLYRYFNTLISKEKNRFNQMLEEKLPGGALDASLAKYQERTLTTMEKIEKDILEGNLTEIPALIKKLLLEDKEAFPYAYDIAIYLETRSSAQSVATIYENITQILVKGEGVYIDKVYLPLVYDRYATTCQRNGDYLKAARVYREFANLEIARRELRNIRSNFIRRELECHFIAGNFEALKALKGELADADSILREDAIHGFSCLALAFNELKEYDRALDLIEFYGLDTLEMTFFKNILLYNKGVLTQEALDEIAKVEKNKENPILKIYYDYLKTLLQFQEGAAVDSIKLFNGITQESLKLAGPNRRKIQSLAALKKARGLMLIGRLKDSLEAFDDVVNRYKEDYEGDIHSLILSAYREMTHLEKTLGDENGALSRIEAGLDYLQHPENEYDQLNRGRLLVARVDTYNHLIKDDTIAVAEAVEHLSKFQNNVAFKRLSVRLDLIRVGHSLQGSPRDALILADTSWGIFKGDDDEEISTHLYQMMILVKEYYRTVEEQDHYEEILLRITSKYPGAKGQELNLLGALALKELADYYYAQEKRKEALATYGKIIDAYDNKGFGKLETLLTESLVRKGELFYREGKYQDACDSLDLISKKPEGEFLNLHDLLKAQCLEGLDHIEGAIELYELYLGNVRNYGVQKEDILKVYWSLAKLFGRIGKIKTAEKYLDEIIALEENTLKLLEAYTYKGNLFHDKDKDYALAIFKEAILRFKDIQETGVIETMLSIYAKLGYELAVYDVGLFRELALKAIYGFDGLKPASREDLYKALKNSAMAMEEQERIEDEKWIREQMIQVFNGDQGMEYQIELAKNYYRLLMLSIVNGFHYEIEDCYNALKANTENQKEEFVIDYYYKGIMAYGIDYFRRQNYGQAKEILAELLKKKDFTEARYYYARVLESLGDRKGALRELNKIFLSTPGEGTELLTYFEAALIRISLIKGVQGLFNRNLKKLVREMETKLIPMGDAQDSIAIRIQLGYELGLLYELLGNPKKAQEIYRKLIDDYNRDTDYSAQTALKKVYSLLGKRPLV